MTNIYFPGGLEKIYYLDISNNQISNLDNFKESGFFLPTKRRSQPGYNIAMDDFVLDLQNNEIKKIPYWILALEHKFDLLLAGNPINCTCDEAPQYRRLWAVSC